MADGSHFGFIQKPVSFEPFEITTPNLLSRLSTYLEFSRILKFAVFQKSKMADSSHLEFIWKAGNFWTVWDNWAKFGIQILYKPRIQPDLEIFRFFRNARWRMAAILDLFKTCNCWTVRDNRAKLVSRLSSKPEFGQILNFAVFQKSKMANGSHIEFIQKSVTFEPFEITTPNLVSRFSTTPEFGQILKFFNKNSGTKNENIMRNTKKKLSPRRQNMTSRIKNTIWAY